MQFVRGKGPDGRDAAFSFSPKFEMVPRNAQEVLEGVVGITRVAKELFIDQLKDDGGKVIASNPQPEHMERVSSEKAGCWPRVPTLKLQACKWRCPCPWHRLVLGCLPASFVTKVLERDPRSSSHTLMTAWNIVRRSHIHVGPFQYPRLCVKLHVCFETHTGKIVGSGWRTHALLTR